LVLSGVCGIIIIVILLNYRSVMTMSDAERIVANVNASMAMEGVTLTEEEKNRIKDCIEGRKSFDEEIKKLVEYYKKAV
jgi:hypothetical protein